MDSPAIANFIRPGCWLISKVRVSSLDRARDSIDLVAASVDASLGIVEHAIFGEDFVNRRAPARRVVLTEDVTKITGQQGRYAVGHGSCFSSQDRVPLALMYSTPLWNGNSKQAVQLSSISAAAGLPTFLSTISRSRNSSASIAHEVNQPLPGIITNASRCLRMLAATPIPLVTGDRVQLEHVIINLLKNASGAMRAVNNCPRQLRSERNEAQTIGCS